MRKIGNEGSLRSRDRCNEPWIVDGTPINYSSHIKNHSDLFFTWPSPPPSPVSWTTRMDREFFWISFIGFKTRFDSKIQIIWKWIYEIDLSNIYQVLKYLWRISPSKTRFPFRGDFIILLVEIKLEMKLDKLLVLRLRKITRLRFFARVKNVFLLCSRQTYFAWRIL